MQAYVHIMLKGDGLVDELSGWDSGAVANPESAIPTASAKSRSNHVDPPPHRRPRQQVASQVEIVRGKERKV